MTPFLTSQYRARVLVAFGSLLSAQAGAAQTSGSNPSAVNKPTLTYVPEQRAAVLFGGHTRSGTPLGETWLLKAGCWRQLDVSGPAPRGGHGAAYDTQRRRLVVFGGSGADRKPLGDTWEFDGAKWEQRSASGPPARMLLRMTFDTQRRRVLLFGGTDNMTGPHLGDTWQWDGTSWSPITDSGLPPRFEAALAYDATHNLMVVFGGNRAIDRNFAEGALGDTWLLRGSTWQEVPGPGPSKRDHHGMAFHTGRGVAVLFGGSSPRECSAIRGSSTASDGRSNWRRVDRPPAGECRQ
jgi:hypothetical protein